MGKYGASTLDNHRLERGNMDFGMGILVGVTSCVVFGAILAVIIAVARKTAAKQKAEAPAPQKPAASPARTGHTGAVARTGSPTRAEDREPRTGNTLIIDAADARESQLNKSLVEVRAMLLRLADVISHTNDASGEAAEAFSAAKKVIDAVDLDNGADLADAQKALLLEIDKVVRTNAKLQTELAAANQGIETQRRQIEELRQAARVDSLTRIPNRAAFDERLREYVSLLDRTGLIFSLLLLDIDHFKRINDEYGHLNGDRILRGVASKITDSIRTNDFAARYGGEEFAVILPGTALDEAVQVSERIRQDVAKTNFRLDGKNIKMTISGGLCQCHKGMKSEAVINEADQALYRAKNEGRNRIERRQERNA